MAIRTEDIKLKASQRLTDQSNGGGYMTASEVVDGNINNLFPDISRWDRTYGRVSKRKAYLHVDTDSADVYYGAHAIISELAKDPGVNMVIFGDSDDASTGADAINRLESYTTLGPRSKWYMWEGQPAGSRHILLFSPDTR